MIFDFLKYCLGNEVDVCEFVAKMDWRQLYDFAKKQAMIGFGLRQLLDYYFVVVKWHTDLTKFTDFDSTDLAALQRDLKWLGLWKFAGTVMYVLHEVFGLKDEEMIVPMNEKEGAFLLDEIMRGGNFGQYDDRLGDKTGEGKVHRYFRMSLRNMRFVKHYPSEAICEPLFRTWFFFWKKWKK